MNFVSINANAKVNFSLDIVGHTENGYHAVEMIMQTISAYDKLVLYTPEAVSELRGDLTDEIVRAKEIQQERIERRIAKGIPYTPPDPDDGIIFTSTNPLLPADSKNDCYKAALMMKKEAGYTKKIGIHLKKKLPVGGGLGGGSADAAATLVGLNKLFGLNYSCEKLMEFGAKIGSDVPFLVKGGTCLATGTGTDLRVIPSVSQGHLVIFNPKIFVSTQDVYTKFDRLRLSPESHPDTPLLLDALENGDLTAFAENMKNVLEYPAFELYPEIMSLKKKVKATGPLGTVMSGSGSTIIAIYESRDEAYNVVRKFRNESVFALATDLCETPRFFEDT